MQNCQIHHFNSSQFFNFEQVVGPDLIKRLPPKVAEFAKAHFPYVEGTLKQCEEQTAAGCFIQLEITDNQNFLPRSDFYSSLGLRYIHPEGKENVDYSDVDAGSNFVGVTRISNEPAIDCIIVKLNKIPCTRIPEPDAHIKEIIQTRLQDSEQYKNYRDAIGSEENILKIIQETTPPEINSPDQKLHIIGLGVLAAACLSAAGYGFYKLYKRCTSSSGAQANTKIETAAKAAIEQASNKTAEASAQPELKAEEIEAAEKAAAEQVIDWSDCCPIQ
jgi:hypothetical protein